MMKKILFIYILVLFSFVTLSQDVVFENEVKDYSELDEKGPNLKKFNFVYYNYGFVLGESLTGAKINYGSSSFSEIGFRHKRKLNSVFSVGYSIGSRFLSYSITQEAGKILPDTIINRKEELNFNSVISDVYLRINFSKNRGNIVGLYMDIGAEGNYNYQMLHQTKNTENGIKSKTNKHGYDFDIPYNYGPVIRFGYNTFALTASYRYSDFFNASANLPELARILLGIEIGSFK